MISAVCTCRSRRIWPSCSRLIRSCVDWCGGIGPSLVDPLSRIGCLCAGQASRGGWPFGLEHASVGLTDVTVSGDGGGFVKVRLLLLLLLLLVSSHGKVVKV